MWLIHSLTIISTQDSGFSRNSGASASECLENVSYGITCTINVASSDPNYAILYYQMSFIIWFLSDDYISQITQTFIRFWFVYMLFHKGVCMCMRLYVCVWVCFVYVSLFVCVWVCLCVIFEQYSRISLVLKYVFKISTLHMIFWKFWSERFRISGKKWFLCITCIWCILRLSTSMLCSNG